MADETHETKIVISGDSTSAENALSRVSSKIGSVVKSVSSQISRITTFLSRLNWAITAVTTVIDAFKKLGEWIHRAETEAKRLREEIEKSAIVSAIAREADAYKKLNDHLSEALRLEKERQEIIDKRKSTSRDNEDAQTELRREREIAALDPMAEDYDERKREIERRYEREASSRTAARSREDNSDVMKKLLADAAAKDKTALSLRAETDRAWKVEERAAAQSFRAGVELDNVRKKGGDVETAERNKAEADEAWKRAFDIYKELEKKMLEASKEADSLRSRAAEFVGGGYAANVRNAAAQLRIDNEERSEKAKAEKEASAQAEKEREAAEKEREAADRKAAAEVARDEKSRRDAANAAKLDRASDLESFSARLAAQEGVSTNRLTAMGLGSGVQGSSGVASDVKKLVELLREEVAATKEIDTAATFGD